MLHLRNFPSQEKEPRRALSPKVYSKNEINSALPISQHKLVAIVCD